MTNYERHPLSLAGDDMTPEEWASFDADIAKHGVIKAITIYQGKVLDGWHRYQSAKGHKMLCPEEVFGGTDEEARDFVRSMLRRKHLTASQRAVAEAKIGAWNMEVAPGDIDDSATLSEQAENAQVSERTMGQARSVVRNAIPQVIKAVDDGELSIKKAAGIALQPRREQAKALKEAKQPKTPKPWKAVAPLPRPEVGASKEAFEQEREKTAILSEENDSLNARLAVHFMEGTDEEKLAASALIADLQAEVKTLKAELSAVKASRTSYMNEASELKKQCAMQRNQLAKYRGSDDRKAA